jgi:hypothetical protein
MGPNAMRYRTMLEYFGFYAPAPEGSEPQVEAETETEACAEVDEHARAVARAARLADRRRHTPSSGPTGPAWDKGSSRDR